MWELKQRKYIEPYTHIYCKFQLTQWYSEQKLYLMMEIEQGVKYLSIMVALYSFTKKLFINN